MLFSYDLHDNLSGSVFGGCGDLLTKQGLSIDKLINFYRVEENL